MPSKFLNISVDNTLGGVSPSDQTVSSQKAIKDYVDGNYVTISTTQTISGTKTFTEPVTIQNGQGTGCLIVGANVNSSTLSNNQRKLARINAPSYANKDLGATLIGWDTSGDSDSPVTNKSYDSVCFGGMKKITNCTSPMSITFCVTDTRAATAATNKKYALAMDANEAIFGVQPKYNGNNLATVNQIPTTAAQVNALPDTTDYAADLSYSNDVLQLLDQDGNAIGNPVTIQSSPDIDGKSITTNSDDELQTVGVIDQNNPSTPLKQWSGTKAQYDAIVSKDANTIYNITDDNTSAIVDILSITYPVGSIYIGTMNTCPLAALFGTWTLVAADRVLQGSGTYDAGDTVEAGLPNITGNLPNARNGSANTSGTVGTGALKSYEDGATGLLSTYSASGYYVKSRINFDASQSNSIYGNSTTVQPPAFVVNIWQRIA